ncbi:MAG: hypothetical protein ACF8PG_10330 [Maioricimonas sp. JB045]|uniref:hypothetical protein n=1 Tax=Maioricimonas sp. JC845 TaxID=3232138 RepID=UPI00345B13F6
MKGGLGLALATALGIVGAVCNWLYLERLARQQETVSFIAVRSNVQLEVGDAFKDSHLMRVDIPRSGVGNLDRIAPLWSAKEAVIGERANRPFAGGEIILESDLVTPAVQDLADTLQANEVARWVPIDSRSVVPQQINPGDLVSFEVPRTAGPTPAGTSGGPASPSTGTELIGPFRVLALGNRREPPNVQEANRRRSTSESTMTIVVRLENGQLEPKAAHLFEALRRAGNQGARVQLHSSRYSPQ